MCQIDEPKLQRGDPRRTRKCFKKESLLVSQTLKSYSQHVRQPRANSPRPLNY